jgi:hypothetical protein
MHSSPVQPTSSSSSGTGSVMTMWEEATVRRLRSGPRGDFAAAPTASTAARALTTPPGVRASTPDGEPARRVTGERSRTSTPRARRRSRSPRASRAGCTVAAPG